MSSLQKIKNLEKTFKKLPKVFKTGCEHLSDEELLEKIREEAQLFGIPDEFVQKYNIGGIYDQSIYKANQA